MPTTLANLPPELRSQVIAYADSLRAQGMTDEGEIARAVWQRMHELGWEQNEQGEWRQRQAPSPAESQPVIEGQQGREMPYTVDSAPAAVRNVLPKHAIEIWTSAFNSAWEQYDPARHRGTQEEFAARVAWAAVGRDYERGSDGKWHPKRHKDALDDWLFIQEITR